MHITLTALGPLAVSQFNLLKRKKCVNERVSMVQSRSVTLLPASD